MSDEVIPRYSPLIKSLPEPDTYLDPPEFVQPGYEGPVFVIVRWRLGSGRLAESLSEIVVETHPRSVSDHRVNFVDGTWTDRAFGFTTREAAEKEVIRVSAANYVNARKRLLRAEKAFAALVMNDPKVIEGSVS